MTYDSIYGKSHNVFGHKHEPVLQTYSHLITREYPILDIGMGQGRNTVFLARQGFVVHGIDPSAVAVETVALKAKQEALPIIVQQTGFQDHAPSVACYSAILVFGLIQILTWEAIESLLGKVKLWTAKGGLVFVTAFSTNDPSYTVYSAEGRSLGRNSYRMDNGAIRTFLEPDEILTLFREFSTVHHWEGMGPYHRHGKGPRERHAMVEGVFQKRTEN